MQIHQLRLRFSNAYLLQGDRPILVDTGAAGDTASLRSQLNKHHVDFSDLALILHTHVHADHMGCTMEVAAAASCPVAWHPAEQPLIDQSHNGRLTGVGLRGRIMSRLFSNIKFKAVPADVALCDGMSLADYGCAASILETPGHTPGSVSVVTESGDAVIGDVIMGGSLGGLVQPTQPNFHYFADDINQAMSSLDTIVERTRHTLYTGHGGPLHHDVVQNWRQRQK